MSFDEYVNLLCHDLFVEWEEEGYYEGGYSCSWFEIPPYLPRGNVMVWLGG